MYPRKAVSFCLDGQPTQSERGMDVCCVRISRKSATVKWNTASGREWPLPTAVRCWLAEEQKEENGSPIKKGHHCVAFFLMGI